jgi:hypothetical protein
MMQCQICLKRYLSEIYYREHIKSCGIGQHCVTCGKNFISKSGLRRHKIRCRFTSGKLTIEYYWVM